VRPSRRRCSADSNRATSTPGAVLGVLLWIEAADLPDAPIPAVVRCGSREIPALHKGA
jgi:hypothetical protein